MGSESILEDNDVKSVIQKLDKQFGDRSVILMNDNTCLDIPIVSSGSLSLDRVLGVNGFPKGRIIEIFGPESSGKTTLCLQCIREAHKLGGLAVFIDAEYSFDKKYAEMLGVDMSKLYLSQPNCGEEALKIVEELVKTNVISVVVVDSVAALIPKAELEGDIGDSRIGLHARLMSQALRKLTGLVSRTGCICIFTNQLREKVGVIFGSPETTTGGNALKFYSSIRLDIRKVSAIKDEKGNIIGNRTRVKVVKNKVAPPFRSVEFDILYGLGVDNVSELLDLCVELGIIKKSGSWFYYNDDKLGQGRDSTLKLLREGKDIFNELYNKIKSTDERSIH